MAENGAGEEPVFRRFSRTVSRAAENLEAAVEDMGEFLNVSQQVETAMEEQAAAEEAAASKDETPEEAAAKDKAQRAAKEEAGFFDPTKIRMRDKIVFFLGVMNVG